VCYLLAGGILLASLLLALRLLKRRPEKRLTRPVPPPPRLPRRYVDEE
jgi:hypothetical protein